MEKKLPLRLSERILPRRGIVVQLLMLFIMLCSTGVHARTYAQSAKFNIKMSNTSVANVLNYISNNSEFSILYDGSLIKDLPNVSINRTDATVDEILKQCFSTTNINYVVTNKTIVLSRKGESTVQQEVKKVTIKGKVMGPDKKPVPGATVLVVGTTQGAIVGDDGSYSIEKVSIGATLEVSFIGYVTVTKVVDAATTTVNFELKEDAMKVDDVVVTGYFPKSKNSFTGAEVTVKGDALRQVGSLNFMQAISVFDPSVRTIPNNEFGSDPNRVPDITIRGENGFDLRSTADDSRTNPNSPLYILDGIEVSATAVYDLDMNRIESFTILKDASATSLYGSRGANGVIVIQTILPEEGEIKVSVNANYFLSIPDLRDYNLMNASEKLSYERLANVYTSTDEFKQYALDELYNTRLAEALRGVDTYWLSRPLRTSVNQRYNAYIEGGDGSFRYGVDLKYDNDQGVMKGSGREKYGINVNFNYNIGKRFFIRNDVQVSDIKGDNSPYGAFSNFTSLNPYERLYDPITGKMLSRFESNDRANPLIDSQLPNKSFNKYLEIRDNFTMDWRINDHFRVNGRMAITKKVGSTENYRSPYSTDFERETDPNKRGSYTIANDSELSLDGNITASYNNTFKDKWIVSVGVGSNITTSNLTGDGFTATGFLNDNMNYIQYAQQYKDKGKPTGSYDKSRMVGFFSNVNLGYDNKYFIDASFRTDGSSRFGRDSRFAPFWSLGGAWNINKESWWSGSEGTTMKLRASVGSTGTTNFSADQAMTKYEYTSASEYNGTYGAVLMGYGNPALKWQNTLQYNVGFDMSIWKNIIVLNLDAYLKQTQNLLLPIDVAPSTGFYSYTENMGSMDNKGVDVRLRFNLINNRKQDLIWNVTLAASHNTNVIKNLSNALMAMNEQAYKLENSGYNPKPNESRNETSGELRPLRVYEAGRSQSALMVVRSMGIDPATGNEIYVKLNGDLTYDYDPRDKVIVGDTNPLIQGNFQSNLSYKGFNLFFVLSYEYGAVAYNSTLAQKVEGSDPKHNADKRVLYDRWKKAGDVAMFRRIDDQTTVYQSTRLVQDNNFLSLSTLSLSYEFPREKLQNIFLERCKFVFTATDLFRMSTIKQERGTSYPFAQSFSLGVNLTF